MTKNYRNEGTLLIRNSDIKDNYFEFDDNPIFLDEVFANTNKSRKLKSDDVVTIHTGDVGTSAVIGEDEEGAIGFATINTRPDTKILKSEFLATFLNSPQHKKYAIDHSTGDGRSNYNLRDYNELLIPLTTSAEQEKIGGFFKYLKSLISHHQNRINKLKIVKKSMLEKMFPKKDSVVPEIRFNGFTSVWKQCNFGECVLIQRGGSPRPIEEYLTKEADGVNWIKIGDVETGSRYITSTKEKIKPEGEKKSRRVFIGDLILSNSMSFGRPYIMQIEGCIHDGWLLIRDEKEIFDVEYLLQLLSSDYMHNQYKSLASGGVVNNLNTELVQSTTVLIPQKEEQKKIGEYFKQLDNLIVLQQQKIEKLKNIKKALLEKMFVSEV